MLYCIEVLFWNTCCTPVSDLIPAQLRPNYSTRHEGRCDSKAFWPRGINRYVEDGPHRCCDCNRPCDVEGVREDVAAVVVRWERALARFPETNDGSGLT